MTKKINWFTSWFKSHWFKSANPATDKRIPASSKSRQAKGNEHDQDGYFHLIHQVSASTISHGAHPHNTGTSSLQTTHCQLNKPNSHTYSDHTHKSQVTEYKQPSQCLILITQRNRKNYVISLSGKPQFTFLTFNNNDIIEPTQTLASVHITS